MKRLLAFLPVAALAGVAGAAPAAVPPPVSYDALGITLLHRLASRAPHENVFISPLSIGVALSMVADGAAGTTREQIAHALDASAASNFGGGNAQLLNGLRDNHDAKLGIANALWLRQDIPPARAYVDKLAHDYHAGAQAVHFGDPSAAAAINAWTKAHTLGLVDRIVDQTSPNDFAYLTNALAFEGQWAAPFKKGATHQAPFTSADGQTRNVEMMTNTATYKEADELNFRVARLAYGDGGFAAYILLPSDRNADQLVKELRSDVFRRLTPALRDVRLQLSLPRFTARYDASLVPALKALGMTDPFSDAANFSTMHPPPPQLRITSVRHASYVHVDEAGTVAAAATSAGISLTSIEVPESTFVVDRPFVFAIRDEHAGTLLFLGVINRIE